MGLAFDRPLKPAGEFYRGWALHSLRMFAPLLGWLLVGIFGYRITEGMPWIDSLLNASMLLGGMGPVGELHTTGGKLFASFYAITCGVFVLVIAGVVLGPPAHRFLHRLHLEGTEGPPESD